jgi:glucose/arabinose dehydrogenase
MTDSIRSGGTSTAGVPAAVLLLLAAPAGAYPPNFNETLVASGFGSPTAMEFAPDGRLFVCRQNGELRVIKNGTLQAVPFMTLTVDNQGERGLLGIAFDPNFASNQLVYVYYTTPTPAVHNRVSKFKANGDVRDTGVAEVVLVDLENLSTATNHNGGAIHFGPSDGKLYVSIGENANMANSMNKSNRLGKMLRLNTDGTAAAGNPTVFPNSSGTFNAALGLWAVGLRNPFTFAIQPVSPFRMFINDVGGNGDDSWEEINEGAAGANYNWSSEATDGYLVTAGNTAPRFAYRRNNVGAPSAMPPYGNCIAGGAFYNPPIQQFPNSYVGKYFFGEYAQAWIGLLDYSTNPGTVTQFHVGGNIGNIVDLKVGPDGALYYLTRSNGGAVYKVTYGSSVPSFSQHPANQTRFAGQTATFTAVASGTPTPTLQWQRRPSGGSFADIGGATSGSYTTPVLTNADNGAQYRCVATNDFGSTASNAATLTITTNQPPAATILTPASGTVYAFGDVIGFSGQGTDPEDGNLPGSAFTWRVDFHHDTHTHPHMPDTAGSTSGQFTAGFAETATNTWYRIHLTVTDSLGATHSVFRDVKPLTSKITLKAVPWNAVVTIDGAPFKATKRFFQTRPVSFTAVEKQSRTIGAPSPQVIGSKTYVFSSWSDGGAQNHSIIVPSPNTTYTVTFVVQTAAAEPVLPEQGSLALTAVPRPQHTAWLGRRRPPARARPGPAG